jgi:membrane fusion protein, multidrug efflux system
MMRHRRLWAVLLGLLAGPLHAENAAPVDVERLPARAPAATLDLTGSVSTARVSRLSPDVAGRVEQVHHDAGDSVSAGTPLMTLDAQLAVLAGQRTAAAVREAEIGAREASRLVAEADRLVERGNLPASQLEVRRAAQAQAEAAAARLRAEAAEQQERIRRHILRAPFDGVVTARFAEAGEWVTPGTPVLEVLALQDLRLDVQVPQEHFGRLDTDAPVTLRFDHRPEQAVTGQVIAQVPQASNSARTFLLRVGFETDLPVVPGMSARVRLPLPDRAGAMSVPRDAILRRADGSATVWVVDRSVEPPVARDIAVELGAPMGDRVQVRGALPANAELIVRGNERLQPGQALTVRER